MASPSAKEARKRWAALIKKLYEVKEEGGRIRGARIRFGIVADGLRLPF